ncbi:MAG: 30S ribosomal protein S16, partial [candidate division NC10 bacterium]|nr:30S ribosomal protein S16 [candidate division NC10 bacterium]
TKKRPSYRVVVTDSRMPRDGRFLEALGTWDPQGKAGKGAALALDAEKALAWLRKGARPTETVRALLSTAGVLRKFAELKTAKTTA